MSLSNNVARYHEWTAIARDLDRDSLEGIHARWNAAAFERDIFAEILRLMDPAAYRVAFELMHPGSTASMNAIMAVALEQQGQKAAG